MKNKYKFIYVYVISYDTIDVWYLSYIIV